MPGEVRRSWLIVHGDEAAQVTQAAAADVFEVFGEVSWER
jgi:hypothetical protein